MDAEQIRGEMRQTRASIDRKFDILAAELSIARQQALRTAAMIAAAAAAVIGLWSWRRHHTTARVRIERYGDRL